jgi:hypothetical protein
VSDNSLECYRTTSEYVPEHRQFTDMMNDVHAYIRRERQIERATRDRAPQGDILDITKHMDQLHCENPEVIMYKIVADHKSGARWIRRR